MFFKTVYNSLFNINSYKDYKKKSMISSIGYIISLLVVFCTIFSCMSLYKFKPLINSKIDEIYSLVPNFKLSSQGLEIDNHDSINISFGGTDFIIDDTKMFLELIIEDEATDDRQKTYIGKDGLGVVNGTVLNQAEYFKDMVLLKNQTLEKEDFKMIYEIIRLMSNDVFILVLIIFSIIVSINIFVKNILYAILLKSVLFMKKESIGMKDAYKLALYSQTFFIVYSGVILFSNMNIILPFKLMIIEIITIIYIFLIAHNLKK